MRFVRLLFVLCLAIVLIAIALANRQTVSVSAFPADFGTYLGGRWSVDLPLFLLVFVVFAFGMLAGLIWEWLREGHIRRAARQRDIEAQRLESEVGSLRQQHAAPRDEVLAILDNAKRPANPAANTRTLAAAEPAPALSGPR